MEANISVIHKKHIHNTQDIKSEVKMFNGTKATISKNEILVKKFLGNLKGYINFRTFESNDYDVIRGMDVISKHVDTIDFATQTMR
jgi:hypothetical protein